MNELEQQNLLLRQVAGLRVGGLPHHQALALAGRGLPPGPLQVRTTAALHSLARGDARGADEGSHVPVVRDPWEALLGSDCSIDQLTYAAAGVEARLQASSALRTARLYLALGLSIPLFAASVAGWLYASWPYPVELPGFLGSVLGLARYFGIPMAILAIWLVGRFSSRLAPGHRLFMRAAALSDLAITGVDPSPDLLGPAERTFYEARRARVGAPVAARDLAENLSRRGQRSVAVFRHVAPALGLLTGVAVVAGMVTVLIAVLYGMVASLGVAP